MLLPEWAGFLPIWSCSVWGLPCPRHYCRGGALLPHLFTLTPVSFYALVILGEALSAERRIWACRAQSRSLRRNICAFGTRPCTSAHNDIGAVCFLWHFPSIRLEPDLPDVIRHTALRSSDFPPRPFSQELSSSLLPEWTGRPSGPAAYHVIICDAFRGIAPQIIPGRFLFRSARRSDW